MLSSSHFYHRITRKLVVAFGTMFNNIMLKRYNKENTVEIERIIVPLTYMSKEKFYQRLAQDPNLSKEVQINLPRMTFDLESIVYDPLRKVSAFQKYFAPKSNTEIKTTYSTPYNFNFTLNIFVRNTEDGTQIIEQILPYFNPDYTLSVNFVDIADPIDVPIILESVGYSVDNTDGPMESLRTIVWTLEFTVKAYLFGPITNTAIIRQSTANTFDSIYNSAGSRKIVVTQGSGDYKIGELVFIGKSLTNIDASAYVDQWNNVSNTLTVSSSSGTFSVNNVLTGASTNTAYKISSFDVDDKKISNLTVRPDPSTANANSAFGFDETLEEYPDIT